MLAGKCSYFCYFPDCHTCSSKPESFKRHSEMQNEPSSPHNESPTWKHRMEENHRIVLEDAMILRDRWRNLNYMDSVKKGYDSQLEVPEFSAHKASMDKDYHPQPKPSKVNAQNDERPPTGNNDTQVPTSSPGLAGRQARKAPRKSRWDNPPTTNPIVSKNIVSESQLAQADPDRLSFHVNLTNSKNRPQTGHYYQEAVKKTPPRKVTAITPVLE